MEKDKLFLFNIHNYDKHNVYGTLKNLYLSNGISETVKRVQHPNGQVEETKEVTPESIFMYHLFITLFI